MTTRCSGPAGHGSPPDSNEGLAPARPLNGHVRPQETRPRAVSPRHTHPGEEIIYVLEGTLEYQIAGKPPVRVKPGDVLFVPAGTISSLLSRVSAALLLLGGVALLFAADVPRAGLRG